MMRQYEMCELAFEGPILQANYAAIDMTATISNGTDTHQVNGFYAADGCYKVRFLPRETGIYQYKVTGCIQAQGSVEVTTGDGHGVLKANGRHFAFEDGTVYYPFGTTVYALAHQEDALVEETMQTLATAPFNKIRLCVFPKHYNYNLNEPKYYAFEKDADGNWDVNRPCLVFWDDFEAKMCRLDQMGIQVDLILFHPYDRWGFSKLSREDNLLYLDYLLRRFAAYPFFWWSLANEFDFCYPYKTRADFEEIEEYVAANDPYGHLLSCHNCFAPWDFARAHTTHVSYQAKTVYHVGEWGRTYNKPVLVDECCYEGNLPKLWGCLSGEEMTARFWETMVGGGYCTHGETYLDRESEILWWAKGGKLIGTSPARIAFLRDFIYSLPGGITPVKGWHEQMSDQIGDCSFDPQDEKYADIPEFIRGMMLSVSSMTTVEREWLFAGEHVTEGQVNDNQVHLWYLYQYMSIEYDIELPTDRTYRIVVIDTWNMTRETVLQGVSGKVTVPLQGKAYTAIVAYAED